MSITMMIVVMMCGVCRGVLKRKQRRKRTWWRWSSSWWVFFLMIFLVNRHLHQQQSPSSDQLPESSPSTSFSVRVSFGFDSMHTRCSTICQRQVRMTVALDCIEDGCIEEPDLDRGRSHDRDYDYDHLEPKHDRDRNDEREHGYGHVGAEDEEGWYDQTGDGHRCSGAEKEKNYDHYGHGRGGYDEEDGGIDADRYNHHRDRDQHDPMEDS